MDSAQWTREGMATLAAQNVAVSNRLRNPYYLLGIVGEYA